MKAFKTAVLLIFIIGNIGAVDTDSHLFIDYLRALGRPGAPQVFGNSVVFTAPSSFSRVGIAFAHENYTRVHWFSHLLVPRDVADLYVDGRLQRDIDENIDSGILFYAIEMPENLTHIDYRLVMGGLWTTDPLNPVTVTGPSGVTISRVSLPPLPRREPSPAPGTYRFSFNAPPGESVTVGGDFNNWDPFMYQLRETSAGHYTLTLRMPPGTFQYVFYHRGLAIPNPANPNQAYSRDGRHVSVGVVN